MCVVSACASHATVALTGTYGLVCTLAGEKELVTAPLDGTVLPGVTRDSTLALAREWGEFKVTERKYYFHELAKAADEGRVRLRATAE